ncbi:hypothetical protein [Methylomonas koyamae]|uniref:hypothetical protein n=1 Tax=Methylomonas koyamae TaxID=702114 RepID=UPI00112C83EC|nr:hypothetical protein [Methylomonas koyamae]TPQ24305.1 hypothetical protein C2U68_20370 [Methylomonas koyamae]
MAAYQAAIQIEETIMYKPVFCICQDLGQTMTIVNNLKLAGFANNEISLLFSDTLNPSIFPQNAIESGNSAAKDSGNQEWFNRAESLEIQGLGRFIAGGPVRVELCRTPDKGCAEDLTTALIGVGIPAHHAGHYQEKIKAGYILVAVNTARVATRDAANAIFLQANAADISSSEEVSAFI